MLNSEVCLTTRVYGIEVALEPTLLVLGKLMKFITLCVHVHVCWLGLDICGIDYEGAPAGALMHNNHIICTTLPSQVTRPSFAWKLGNAWDHGIVKEGLAQNRVSTDQSVHS